MTTAPKVTLAFPGIGLPSLRPSDIWAWLERARAGELSQAQVDSATIVAYRTWFIALVLKALGSGWDVAWHFRWIRDDFAPPHDINLVGDGMAIVLILIHGYTRLGMDRQSWRLAAGGAALFVLSAPIDVINHRINGLDITSWSITHFGLYAGTAIMIAGVIRGWYIISGGRPNLLLGGFCLAFVENVWFPAQHQEYGVEELASWDRGKPYAEPSLLQFAANQIGRPMDRVALEHFALPVASWVYPVWTVAAFGLTLVIARRVINLPWTATALAGGYLLWRCVLYPVLAVTHFPTSAVPFFIVAIGVSVDLAHRLPLSGPVRAAIGALLVTGVSYTAMAIQAAVLVAPPISYPSAVAAAVLLFAGWAVFSWATQRSDQAFRPWSWVRH